MTGFLLIRLLVAFLSLLLSFFLFFVWHTYLLVPAKRQTTEIRGPEPHGDGLVLFLCLQLSIPERGAEAENE